MAITNRKPSHLPRLEALEDRFLPSVSSMLPPSLSYHSNQMVGADLKDRSLEKNSFEKVNSDGLAISSNQQDRSHLADTAFDPNQGDLTQMMTNKPIMAVITYDPFAMQFHETIWFSMAPIKSMETMVKPKVASSNSLLPDSDDAGSIVRSVIPQVAGNTQTFARPKVAVDDLAKDLVVTAMSVSTNRMAETTPTTSQPVASLSVTNASIVMSKSSILLTTQQGTPGSGLRSDVQLNEAQSPVPVALPEATRGAEAPLGKENTTSSGTRLTEKEGLNTDESSLILNEIEQAIQTLVQPFAVSLESYDPSVLWVFLATWVAAAGISYEYLRRKLHLNQVSIDTWKEWRSVPHRHHS